jgi:hypothetical protein
VTNIDEFKALFDKVGIKYKVEDYAEYGQDKIYISCDCPYWCAFAFNHKGEFLELQVSE